jgi:hypothetical protein
VKSVSLSDPALGRRAARAVGVVAPVAVVETATVLDRNVVAESTESLVPKGTTNPTIEPLILVSKRVRMLAARQNGNSYSALNRSEK